MPYTIKPKNSAGFGSFSVFAGEPGEAIDAAGPMRERGIEEIEVLDDEGVICEAAELERMTDTEEQAR